MLIVHTVPIANRLQRKSERERERLNQNSDEIMAIGMVPLEMIFTSYPSIPPIMLKPDPFSSIHHSCKANAVKSPTRIGETTHNIHIHSLSFSFFSLPSSQPKKTAFFQRSNMKTKN